MINKARYRRIMKIRDAENGRVVRLKIHSDDIDLWTRHNWRVIEDHPSEYTAIVEFRTGHQDATLQMIKSLVRLQRGE